MAEPETHEPAEGYTCADREGQHICNRLYQDHFRDHHCRCGHMWPNNSTPYRSDDKFAGRMRPGSEGREFED